MIYLIDTNVLSDLMKRQPDIRRYVIERTNAGDQLAICRPVYYEILRGLIWRGAARQLQRFRQTILPLFSWVELDDKDWEQAARFWSDARQAGRQLGDPDLLLAAISYRLNATLVSADGDFDALPVHREDWRH